ncbi:protein PRRC2C-like [Folsomia candida]|uniref:Uncharacterized protein n=1 Tax=Folsomia candida TaxID=158441 RepID=A0A226DEB4_FOLCA|nr:protein PRRC2C-like [Folsomia candida]OXA43470.1 hypothetical protein Fcan01_21723 [Folsomia candida]
MALYPPPSPPECMVNDESGTTPTVTGLQTSFAKLEINQENPAPMSNNNEAEPPTVLPTPSTILPLPPSTTLSTPCSTLSAPSTTLSTPCSIISALSSIISGSPTISPLAPLSTSSSTCLPLPPAYLPNPISQVIRVSSAYWIVSSALGSYLTKAVPRNLYLNVNGFTRTAQLFSTLEDGTLPVMEFFLHDAVNKLVWTTIPCHDSNHLVAATFPNRWGGNSVGTLHLTFPNANDTQIARRLLENLIRGL